MATKFTDRPTTSDRRLPVVGDALRFWRLGATTAHDGILGHAKLTTRGWKFYPAVSGRSPSRKHHRTLDGCLPRWVHYPDGCASAYVGAE